MYFDEEKVRDFQRDGYTLVENMFDSSEIDVVRKAIAAGERVSAFAKDKVDASGKTTRLAIWHELGHDIWSAISTSPRIVNSIRILLGEEIAFFHGKVMLKNAREGGAWEWHQDYGYWYQQGFVYPRMISVFTALDPATRQNGCLQVLRGSHRLGRLDHVQIGTQTGVQPERMKQIEPLFERVYCEMKPGSTLFFHCNLLHCSASNESDHNRYSFIVCYNALANLQLGGKKTSEQRPCPVSKEEDITEFSAKNQTSAEESASLK